MRKWLWACSMASSYVGPAPPRKRVVRFLCPICTVGDIKNDCGNVHLFENVDVRHQTEKAACAGAATAVSKTSVGLGFAGLNIVMGRRGQRASERTLVCVIQALVGLELLVELRNDLSIRGVLDDCDNAMNVIVKEAIIEDVEGVQRPLPLVFLRGSNIRFVHIPDNVDIMKLVEDRRLLLDQAATAYMGGKGAPAPKPALPSVEIA